MKTKEIPVVEGARFTSSFKLICSADFILLNSFAVLLLVVAKCIFASASTS